MLVPAMSVRRLIIELERAHSETSTFKFPDEAYYTFSNGAIITVAKSATLNVFTFHPESFDPATNLQHRITVTLGKWKIICEDTSVPADTIMTLLPDDVRNYFDAICDARRNLARICGQR